MIFPFAYKASLIGICIFLLTHSAWSQQDPQFTQYMFNTAYYNPGTTGINGSTRLLSMHRSQWIGYHPSFGGGGAPSTQLFTATTFFNRARSGVGLHVVNDNLGPQNNLEAQISYAYYLYIGQSKLGFGVRTGIYSQLLDFNKYNPIDPDDPLLNRKGLESQVKPDLTAGICFYREQYYLGVSFTHLIQPEFDFGVGQRNKLVPHIYAIAGYSHQINLSFHLDFTGLVKSDFVKTTFDVSTLLYYKNILWGGLSFRQSEAIMMLLGYSFLKDRSLSFGYALDYVIENQAAKQPTSHEFMLAYKLPIDINAEKKIIRTPRYRY